MGAGEKLSAMGSRSAVGMLYVPVRLHGIQLGRTVDVLLDPAEWRAVGFDVLCGDEASRFLPFTTATEGEHELLVDSALMLLEDVDFYRTRTRSLRVLIGTTIDVDRVAAGTLRDLVLEPDGAASEVVLEHEGEDRRVASHKLNRGVTNRRDAA